MHLYAESSFSIPPSTRLFACSHDDGRRVSASPGRHLICTLEQNLNAVMANPVSRAILRSICTRFFGTLEHRNEQLCYKSDNRCTKHGWFEVRLLQIGVCWPGRYRHSQEWIGCGVPLQCKHQRQREVSRSGTKRLHSRWSVVYYQSLRCIQCCVAL